VVVRTPATPTVIRMARPLRGRGGAVLAVVPCRRARGGAAL